MKNSYEVRGDHVAIKINGRKKVQLETLIDLNDLKTVSAAVTGKWRGFLSKNTGTHYVHYAGRRYPMVNGERPKRIAGTALLMHRVIMGAACADGDRGIRRYVDHRNHDTLDNRRSNLRVATATLNSLNRKNIEAGVVEMYGKWAVQIQYRSQRFDLGCFDTKEQAILIRSGAFLLIEKLEAERARDTVHA